jgi:hypothetical protein
MHFTHYSRVLADHFHVPYVTMVPSVAGYLLRVGVSFRTNKWEGAGLELSQVRLKASVNRPDRDPLYLGGGEPESPMLVRFEHHDSHIKTFDIGLSPAQIAALEDLRNGGDLSLRLDVQALADDGKQALLTVANLQRTVPQSEWVKELDRSGYTKLQLFEIPVYDSGLLERETALKPHFDAALNHLNRGHYGDTVAACRKVLEALDLSVQDKPVRSAAQKAFGAAQTEMSASQRGAYVRSALWHYTQLAHHADVPDEHAQFNRADAQWALTTTAATVRHVLATRSANGSQ